jgi:hypothetical protein
MRPRGPQGRAGKCRPEITRMAARDEPSSKYLPAWGFDLIWTRARPGMISVPTWTCSGSGHGRACGLISVMKAPSHGSSLAVARCARGWPCSHPPRPVGLAGILACPSSCAGFAHRSDPTSMSPPVTYRLDIYSFVTGRSRVMKPQVWQPGRTATRQNRPTGPRVITPPDLVFLSVRQNGPQARVFAPSARSRHPQRQPDHPVHNLPFGLRLVQIAVNLACHAHGFGRRRRSPQSGSCRCPCDPTGVDALEHRQHPRIRFCFRTGAWTTEPW